MQDVVITLKVSEEIAKLIQEKGLAELVIRRRDAKYKLFYNALLEGKTDSVRQEAEKKALELLSENEHSLNRIQKVLKGISENNKGILALSENAKINLNQLEKIAGGMQKLEKLQYLQIGLQCANIAVDIAGFVMVYNKLSAVENKIADLKKDVVNIHVLLTNEKIAKFTKLSATFGFVMQKIKDNDPIDRDTLDEFLTDMHSFMKNLKLDFLSDVVDGEIIMEMIISLLSSYTMILGEYIRNYYFEKGKLPSTLNNYMAVYRELLEKDFCDRATEYLFIHRKMNFADAIEANNAQKIIILKYLANIEDLIQVLKATRSKEEYFKFISSVDDAIKAEAESEVAFLEVKMTV